MGLKVHLREVQEGHFNQNRMSPLLSLREGCLGAAWEKQSLGESRQHESQLDQEKEEEEERGVRVKSRGTGREVLSHRTRCLQL